MTDFIQTGASITGTTATASFITHDTGSAVIQLVGDQIDDECIREDAYREIIENNGQKKLRTSHVVVHPRLYFKYVKSKMTRSEKAKLTNRLKKLTYLLDTAKPINQRALVETIETEIVNLYREQEASVQGYDTYVLKEHIDKFKEQVRPDKRAIVLAELEKFPRPIPKDVRDEIKKVKDKEIFDEFWVLFFDKAGKPAKTNKDKIREKDPILFGKFVTEPNKFYFITDWEDEVCDLTFSQFVDRVKDVDSDFMPEVVSSIKPAQIRKIKEAVKERHDRLAKTNMGNYRSLMVEEDKKKIGYFRALWNAIRGKG